MAQTARSPRRAKENDAPVVLDIEEASSPPLAQSREAIFPPAAGMIHVHYAGTRRYGMPVPVTYADGSPDMRRRATTCGTPACTRGFIFTPEAVMAAFAAIGCPAEAPFAAEIAAQGSVVLSADQVADWSNIMGIFAPGGVPQVGLHRRELEGEA